MARKLERIVAIINTLFFTLFFGGYSAVMITLDKGSYPDKFKEILGDAFKSYSTDKQIELLRTLAAWFGITVILVLLLTLIGNYLIKYNHRPKKAGVAFVITGVVALFGTQLIGFVFSFVYFLIAALCFFRCSPINENNRLES